MSEYWGKKAVGEDRLQRWGAGLKKAIPQGTRDAMSGAVRKYSDWVQSAPLKGAVPDGAKHVENKVMNGIGKVANGAARAAGQPEDEWLERNQYLRAAKEQDDATPAVTQMGEMTVQSGDDVSGAAGKVFREVRSRQGKPLVPARHPDDRTGMQGTRMSDKELLAQAKAMLASQEAEGSARMAQGPAVGADLDANGKPLPGWLTQAKGR